MKMLHDLGFAHNLAKEVANSMAMTASLCSFVIFQHHSEPLWPVQPLMVKYSLPLSDVHLPVAIVN